MGELPSCVPQYNHPASIFIQRQLALLARICSSSSWER